MNNMLLASIFFMKCEGHSEKLLIISLQSNFSTGNFVKKIINFFIADCLFDFSV